jgi:hypothetical protein
MADELDEIVARLRAIPRVVEEALPEVARECEKIIAGNIAAQRGPDGVPWPRPADRTQSIVLSHAMKSITVRAIGRVLLARVGGIEARHHLGIIRGKVIRRMIPSKTIPGPFIEAIRRVVLARLHKATHGR